MANTFTYLGTTYTDAEIISGSYSKSESLNMAELPVDTVEITVRPNLHLGFRTSENYPFITADNYVFETSEASPINGSFQQNTPMVQYKDGSQTAIWYLQSIERLGANVYKLNGFSSLGRLTQVTHYGGIYDGTQTVADVVAEIIGNFPYYISPEFENIALYGWLPIAPARDNLQQVLFAINASLQTDDQGVLRIQNLPANTQASIAQSDIFQSVASVKYNTPVTKVVVVEHQYAVGSDAKELFSGVATGNQLIAFDEPMSNLQASGLTIVSSGANYAIVSGTGTLTGTPYIHTMREIERAVATTATVENIVRVDNATLVGITASGDVSLRLSEYYACRNEINIAVAQAFLGCGSVVDTFDPYDEVMRSTCIESEQVNLSNTPKSTITTLIGYTPWQTVPFTDMHVVVATSQTYTMPANLYPGSTVTAILIGGGQGGENGGNGGNGTGGYPTITAHREEINVAGGVGGAGGAAGARGSGGKTIRVGFTVNPSDNLVIAIGQGGAVGGSLGGNTTITHAGNTYTSADGAANPYTDPFDGTTYGIDGVDGVAGGAGGAGGAYTSSGDNGESTDNYAGGSGGQHGGVHIYIPSDPNYGLWGIRGGGGGGGASNASVGVNASNVSYSISGDDGTVSGGNGANGANGSAASAPVHYGDGGSGGNGGGGGGGAGATYIYGKTNPSGRFSVTMYGNTGGTGGAGGAGSAGKQGCVILIYRKPAS